MTGVLCLKPSVLHRFEDGKLAFSACKVQFVPVSQTSSFTAGELIGRPDFSRRVVKTAQFSVELCFLFNVEFLFIEDFPITSNRSSIPSCPFACIFGVDACKLMVLRCVKDET